MLLLWEILHTLLLYGGILDSRLDGNVKGCLSERSFLGIGHTDRQTVPRALQSWCIMSYLKVWFGKYHPGEYDLHSNKIENIKYFTVNFLESSTPTLNHFKKKKPQFGYKTLNQRLLLRKTTLCFLFRCIFWSWRILFLKKYCIGEVHKFGTVWHDIAPLYVYYRTFDAKHHEFWHNRNQADICIIRIHQLLNKLSSTLI